MNATRAGRGAGPLRLLGTLLLAAAAGALAQALHCPLPWMIGPLLAVAMASLAGVPVQGSLVLRNSGLCVIGSLLGLYFTPAVVALVGRLAVPIVLGVLWSLALGYGFYRWLAWRHRADGLSPATTFFAGAIGGASEMAIQAERHQAQVAQVAAAHSLRVLLVVVAIPFALQANGVHGADVVSAASRAVNPMGLLQLMVATAVGGAFMAWRRTPNPWVLGALAVSAALSASGIVLSAVPRPAANAAQMLIAITLGVRFSPTFVRAAPRWLASVALGTAAMVLASAGFAALLAAASGMHPATALLATSPGGMGEMAITASVLGLGVPVVTAFHVTRYVVVLVITEPIWRWEHRRLTGRPGATR